MPKTKIRKRKGRGKRPSYPAQDVRRSAGLFPPIVQVHMHEVVLFGADGALLLAMYRSAPNSTYQDVQHVMGWTRSPVAMKNRKINKMVGSGAVHREISEARWVAPTPEQTLALYKATYERKEAEG